MKELDWTGLQRARADDAFGSEICLTFYLENTPEDFDKIAVDLIALNATNLDGSDSGFVYAKVPVALNKNDIEDKIARVRRIVANTGIKIGVIDLDCTSDWQRSKFYTLWTTA